MSIIPFRSSFGFAVATVFLTTLLSTISGVSASTNDDMATVVVESTLEFGLFPEAELLEPSRENIDNLLTRATEWYFVSISQQSQQLPLWSLTSFNLNYVGHSFCPESETPIMLHFDAVASYSFVGETSAVTKSAAQQTPPPQKIDLNTALTDVNYQDFIMNVVWTEDTSGGILEEVNLVGFTPRKANFEPTSCHNAGEAEEEAEPIIVEEEEAKEVENQESCSEAVQAYYDANTNGSSDSNDDKDPTFITPSCFDQQDSCASDDGLADFLSHDDTIVCNFVLAAHGSTYNSDYPNCTESVYEDHQDLGNMTIRLDDTNTLDDSPNSKVLINPSSSMITVPQRDPPHFFGTLNMSLSWGIGSTCDGLVALFVESPNSNNGESEIIAMGTSEGLADGEVMNGSGMTWGSGAAIHRRRRTHIGCAIGGFTTYTLQGTCRVAGAANGDGENDDLEEGGSSAASTSSAAASVLSVGAAALGLVVIGF